ncbi:AbrB/MazE/SpoVT family DNA-binding domain-containing protein [Candidatus Shapirobacteria bacterium]|nr:AbrB/MazE/SpoVT family DNA-binding domain-containing protein [Candidatus Shapirobacteria bacterium]
MKIGTITTANQKGQIVIPQKAREELGISPHSILNVVVVGNGLYIYPVEEIIPKIDKESAYLEVLKATKGAWAKEDWETLRKKRKKMEQDSSLSRKKKW